LLEERLLANQFSKHLSRNITGAVFEMVDNVWMHSEAKEPPLLCYQTARGGLSFAVTDMGIGVLRTLKKNTRFSHLRTSMSALEEAVKVGVSSDPNGSGLGLPALTRALASLWGRVRLRSGQAALTFNREQEQPKQSHQFLPEMKGFQVSAICRLRAPKA
jgi:anti-sigma regulatory factor (Ser/Thr protein kinase)